MNTMADTSSLLGDFDSVVTADAYITKNLLNDIAKDESLNQYEKAAKYKEAVDKFNKNKCEDEVCSNSLSGYDFEYPLPMHYNDSIVKMVLDVELKILVSLPSDITNESIDRINLNGN